MKSLKYPIFLSIILVLIISASILFVSKDISGDHGLYATYDTVSEIYSDANLVVKGSVLKGYENYDRHLKNNEIYKERLYDVEINSVINNSSGYDVKKGDIIQLSVTMSAIISGTEVELSGNKIESGNYLLFLNAYKDEINDDVVYQNNSPGHLYKGFSNLYWNVNGNNLKFLTLDAILDMKKQKNSSNQ